MAWRLQFPLCLENTTQSCGGYHWGDEMLNYAAMFFVIALIAAIFGFTGIAAGAAEMAQILFFVFAALFVVSLVIGLVRH